MTQKSAASTTREAHTPSDIITSSTITINNGVQKTAKFQSQPQPLHSSIRKHRQKSKKSRQARPTRQQRLRREKEVARAMDMREKLQRKVEESSEKHKTVKQRKKGWEGINGVKVELNQTWGMDNDDSKVEGSNQMEDVEVEVAMDAPNSAGRGKSDNGRSLTSHLPKKANDSVGLPPTDSIALPLHTVPQSQREASHIGTQDQKEEKEAKDDDDDDEDSDAIT